MKSLFTFLFVIVSFSFLLHAYPNGVSGYTKKTLTTGCGTCHSTHGNPNGVVMVLIAGPSTLAPNQTANYTVTISGGTGSKVGVDIAASSGTLLNFDNNLKVMGGELTQPSSKSYVAGQYTFTFKYTAPSDSGEQTLYAVGTSRKSEWNQGENFIVTVGDTSTPVELTMFTGTANGNKILLNWSTASEQNNKGFEVERSTNGIDWNTLAFVEGNGSSSEKHSYSYQDELEGISGLIYYRLKQIDFNGVHSYSSVLNINIELTEFSLSQNYPNPFNPQTEILFSIERESFISLTIYDMLGNEVEVIAEGVYSAGFHKVVFNAESLSSGIYIYELKSKDFTQTHKMVLLR